MMKCDICDKQFSNYRGLNGHKRLHGVSNGSYSSSRKQTPSESSTQVKQCENCGKQVTRRASHASMAFCNNKCQGEHRSKKIIADVESGLGTHGAVKKYLVSKFGEKCLSPNCAWDFTKLIVPVELEHIDGNSDNNKLENCTLLCPNCHSLTPTYGNKNKGNGRLLRREKALASYKKAQDAKRELVAAGASEYLINPTNCSPN